MPSQVPVELPPAVLAFAERGPQWAGFVDRLPRVVRGLLDEWELVPDGPATHGFVSVVVPVVTGGVRAMLKVGFPHEESEHEALALQRWGGHGAVRLLRADPHRSALLLERLDRTDLTGTWDLAACEVVAGLYGRIHVPALPQLRTLTSYVDRWTADLTRLPRGAPVPRRLVEQAVALGHDLVGNPASNGVLVHGDLHYENVLASNRAGEDGWLVIDPKPMSGDPHYELAPMLWNRWDEVTASGDVREAVRRRFHTLVDTAGLDEARARDWVVVRMVHNAMWQIEDRPERPDAGFLTRCVAIAKAVQD